MLFRSHTVLVGYLAKKLGKYATLGLAEDTWALNERVIDEQAFLDQTDPDAMVPVVWSAESIHVVVSGADGRYSINRTLVNGRSVDAVAAALVESARAGKDSVIIISADASSPHQSVITVLEAARRSGLAQITFAAQSSAQAGGAR